MKQRQQNGFTLIELMVTVAIVGILASIAYPAYQDSVTKSRRRDVEGVLLDLSNVMERYFTVNNTYGGVAGTTATPADTGTPNTDIYKIPPGAKTYYTVTISVATATTYTLSAAPISTGPQAHDSCGTLGITQTGAKTPTTAGCW
jgi:type IV pilus assembly protein PilE